MTARPPSRQIQTWHAEMARTGRVVLRTSQTKTGLILLGAICLTLPLIGVLLTQPREGAYWVALGGAVLFGTGACLMAYRLVRPEQVTVEPQGLRWGSHAIPWSRIAEIDRTPNPKHPMVFVRVDARNGPMTPLPQFLRGSTRDQVRFLQEVRARVQGARPGP